MEAHGGRIRAESPGPGQGTRLTFTLPVVDEASGGVSPRRSRLPRDTGERTRILVVDDDPLTLRYVRDALTAAGYAPELTGDPRELPRLIKKKKPQLVVLDLVLPGMDGIELMESVPELSDIPVIFLSALREGRDDSTGVGSGRRGLHRQAVFVDGADGESPGGTTQGSHARPVPGSGTWQSTTRSAV